MVGRVWPRHGHRGRPLNGIVRAHVKDIGVPSQVLRAALSDNGWKIETVEDPEIWWCRERWHLRSVWSPQQRTACLVFLTDPMDEHRGKAHLDHREVWALSASATIPQERREAETSGQLFSFKRNWRSRVPEVIAYLDTLRE
jgi:hypothetical protein